jgi:hypothetical protein
VCPVSEMMTHFTVAIRLLHRSKCFVACSGVRRARGWLPLSAVGSNMAAVRMHQRVEQRTVVRTPAGVAGDPAELHHAARAGHARRQHELGVHVGRRLVGAREVVVLQGRGKSCAVCRMLLYGAKLYCWQR